MLRAAGLVVDNSVERVKVPVKVIEIINDGETFGERKAVDRSMVAFEMVAAPKPANATESWLQRNKAWCVPTSLVGATTAAAAIYSFVFGVPTAVKEAVPASLASMKKAMTSALNVTAPAVPKADAAVVFGKSDSIR